MTSTVYLKLKKNSGSAVVDTIPLKVVGASISVDKQIPAFPIPLSGLATGESVTAALDLGMSSKRIGLQGIITETTIKRSHTKTGGTEDTLTFTAHELAQLIASGVDSTGVAEYQAIDELVLLIPSKVDENYAQVTERNIPLTFRARGAENEKDNVKVGGAQPFPANDLSGGVKGFIQQFSFELSAETTEITFSLDFVIASVLP